MCDEVVICKQCGNPEYWGKMRWLNGKCMCRDCYKVGYEDLTGNIYEWDDLDGERPTIADYRKQEGMKNA